MVRSEAEIGLVSTRSRANCLRNGIKVSLLFGSVKDLTGKLVVVVELVVLVIKPSRTCILSILRSVGTVVVLLDELGPGRWHA